MLSINEITSIWYDSDTPPPKKKVKWEPEKIADFFSNFQTNEIK